LIEGHTLSISALDAAGHALDFAWSANCGEVFPSVGPSTTFTASANGGSLCTVRATMATGSASMDVTIGHDTSQLTVVPDSAIIVEGTERAFTVFDALSHEIGADWTLTPAACGNLSDATGTSTVLRVSTAAGGLSCTVTARVGPTVSSAAVTVLHDVSQVSITPKTATVAGGLSLEFQVLDAFSHPLNVSWAVGPAACGDMSPATGLSSTFATRITAAGSQCTVTAAAAGVSQAATVTVTNGLPARINVTASALEAPEGGTVTFGSVIYDAGGHVLGGIVRSWSTTCGLLESAAGSANSVVLPQEGVGMSCTVTVTVSNGSVSGSATVSMRHARPFTVEVVNLPPTTAPGEKSFTLVATVIDVFGHEIADAPIQWTATCGALSSATGPTTVFTAPAEGGKDCEVTASTQQGDAAFEGAMTLTSPASADIVPILALVAIAAGAVAALLLVRRRRKPAEATAPPPPAAR
jgi:hypothetical protein